MFPVFDYPVGMTITATSDLHYNIARSRGPTEQLAAELSARPAGPDDCLVLVGDLAGAEKDRFDACLALFAGWAGRKFFVAGNHSLWSRTGADAMTLLRDELPARGRKLGFGCLEFEPAIVGPVGLAGTVGWYDYSFRDRSLELPMRFYQGKVAPGAARYFSEHRELLARTDDLAEHHHRLTTRWMDGAYVRLPEQAPSDEQFTRLLADKLAGQLDWLAPRVERIVVFIHHVPFANLMPELPGDQWRFVAAFMGSELFGQVCLAQPKVSHVICGHTHQPAEARNGHIDCRSIGSNYVQKRVVQI